MIRRHRALVLLVAADVGTKVLAFALLGSGETIQIGRGFGLYLALNEWGVMGGVEGIGSVTANSVYTTLLAGALLFLALVVRRLDAYGLSFPLRLVCGTVIFFAVATVIQIAASPFAAVALPPDFVISAIRGSALVLSLALYSVSRSAMGAAVFTLLSAGSVANALSYAYPPFEVIDFLKVPLPGRADLFGVINVADVYVALFAMGFLAWPLVALAAWLLRRASGEKPRRRLSRTERGDGEPIRTGRARAETAD